MKIITDNKKLPKNVLLAMATVGWCFVLYFCWVVLMDSWERAYFAIGAIAGQIPAEINPFIDRYTAHPYQTLAHCSAGLVFAVLGPLQFAAPIRRRFPVAHRISGRIFLPFAIVAGVAGLTISLTFPFFGYSFNQFIGATAALFMLYCFIKAFLLIKQRKFAAHREWMMRGFALGLAVAFFRVLLNDVLQPMGLSFSDSWNIVSAISFPVMLLVAEIWIRSTRPAGSVAG